MYNIYIYILYYIYIYYTIIYIYIYIRTFKVHGQQLGEAALPEEHLTI